MKPILKHNKYLHIKSGRDLIEKKPRPYTQFTGHSSEWIFDVPIPWKNSNMVPKPYLQYQTYLRQG